MKVLCDHLQSGWFLQNALEIIGVLAVPAVPQTINKRKPGALSDTKVTPNYERHLKVFFRGKCAVFGNGDPGQRLRSAVVGCNHIQFSSAFLHTDSDQSLLKGVKIQVLEEVRGEYVLI